MTAEIRDMQHLQELVRGGETDWKQYGEVAVQESDGLLLFNYTPAAQINGRWNWFETVSRGLILSRDTGEVIARPFDKFFNWNEGGRLPAPGAQMVRAVEKMDGSLGISYLWEGHMYVATRGSRFSPQAQWATEWLRANDGPAAEGWTHLFEIIYPENRIVVDYGGYSGLVLLAARNRRTGEYVSEHYLDDCAARYNLRRPASFSFSTPAEIVAAAETLKDAEGWVAEFSDGSRWKFKGDEYRALHKLISGLSFQGVLEAVRAGTLETLLASLPAGPLRWQAQEWAWDIETNTHNVLKQVARFMKCLPAGLDRKEVARRINGNESAWLRPYLFAAYDGKPLRPAILKSAFRDRRDRLSSGEG